MQAGGDELAAERREKIADILHRASCILYSAGCDSPELDAELLLAHALGWERARLLADSDCPVGASRRARFSALLARRRSREPLAYILGHREFYGRDFLVDHRVLVPRPETERLVECVLAWAESCPGHLLLADVGTGCGCVASVLAIHLPQATIHALDSSAAALEVASANLTRHRIAGRVHVAQGDLLDPLLEPVDGIVANLPYVSTSELATLQPEIREREPRAALDGGADGLDVIRQLLSQAARHLKPGGAIFLEIGAEQGKAASKLARHHFPRANVSVLADYARLDRVLQVLT